MPEPQGTLSYSCIYIENEANLSAVGEKVHYNYPNLINVSVHSGVGLGIIMNDRLYIGHADMPVNSAIPSLSPAESPAPAAITDVLNSHASQRAIVTLYHRLKNDDTLDASQLCLGIFKR